ncbi:GH32 C-terminal domain-containing protein [Clostridium thermarum]|uniref:GH32 C-terminal domain-containing protein n=1 Tax=Clostridium thermarum TaxID=1716543 RepID=UPI00111E0E3B|nr:GH32 C-terminal domain-containing protein [Clostridium thermarum]
MISALSNLIKDLVAYWNFDEVKGKIVHNVISNKSSLINYVFNNAKFKSSSDPVWHKGIRGSALLFDGCSTWIEEDINIISETNNKMSIQAWVAPRCHEYSQNGGITAIINQHNEENTEGFILGLNHFGVLQFKVASNGSWYGLRIEDKPLPLNKWSYIAAVYDGINGFIELYINGEKVGYKDLPKNSLITPTSERLIIGKTNNSPKINDIYEVSCYCGLLDELKIYKSALSKEEIEILYKGYLSEFGGELPQPDLLIDRNIFKDDRYRPVYHFISPGYWMNEPHGPLYFEGKYHLFFQHNPHGPLWRQIHWGHMVSDDMVHWKDVPCALTPGKDEIDAKGDWSGCTIVHNGVPTIIYTAGDGPIYSQCIALATSTFKEDGDVELKNWKKYHKPIILQDKHIETEAGEVHFGQFRDPFVWQEEGVYYALIGSGIKKNDESVGGTALLYTSKDLFNWEYRKPLHIGDYKRHPKTGEVWELPVFLPIGKDSNGVDKYVLLINPWFFKPSPHNVKYVWYWTGTWDKNNYNFVLDSDEPQLLDVGEHFTGPSGMVDPKGRTIIFSIAQGKRPAMDENLSGWAHNGGLPISVFLREDGRVGIEPISELKTLRQEEYVNLKDITLQEANEAIKFIKDDCIEIELQISRGQADEVGISLRKTADGEEETLLYYKYDTKEILINRNKSTLNPEYEKGIQGGIVDIGEELLKLHIFLDKSMIEVYVNNLKGLTSRVYPTRRDALGLSLWTDNNFGNSLVKSLRIWKLKSAY